MIQAGCYNGDQIYGGLSVISFRNYSQVLVIPVYREATQNEVYTNLFVGSVYAFIYSTSSGTKFRTYKLNPYSDSNELAAKILYN